MSMAGGGVHVRVMRVVLMAVPDGERGAAVGTVIKYNAFGKLIPPIVCLKPDFRHTVCMPLL